MTAFRTCLALAFSSSVVAASAFEKFPGEVLRETTASPVSAHSAPAPVPGGIVFPEGSLVESPVSPMATGCGNTVGYLGNYGVGGFFWDEVLLANGISLVDMNIAGVTPATLAGIDVLLVDRTGDGTAAANAATIDTWIRGGGVMATEFTANQLYYNPGPLNYLTGVLVDGFWVPSGTVCGGNPMVVNAPASPLATDLPPAWECSGDPMGVFNVYAGIDPQLCVIVSVFGSDRDGDGVDDPAVAMANIDAGVIVAVYSDFGDFQALEDPRDCSLSVDCARTAEDESILVNIACRAVGCGPPPGACCIDFECELLTEDECAAAGGTYQGDGTNCTDTDCGPPTGGCCVGGECEVLTELECEEAGGLYQGDDTDCDGVDCGCSDCPALHATIDAAEITSEGLRKALHQQADAACRALARGQEHTAGNILCAMLNLIEAQEGHHLVLPFDQVLRDCIHAFAVANGIPLGVPAGRCGFVHYDPAE